MIIKNIVLSEIKSVDIKSINDSASLLHVAAMNNAIKCFDYLLNDIQIPLNSKSEKGFLPIHYSLQFGSYEISSHILSIYKNNQNEESSSNPENTLENLFSQDYCNTNQDLNLLYNCILRKKKIMITQIDLLIFFSHMVMIQIKSNQFN